MFREESPGSIRSEPYTDPHIGHDIGERFLRLVGVRFAQSAAGSASGACDNQPVILATHAEGDAKFARPRA